MGGFRYRLFAKEREGRGASVVLIFFFLHVLAPNPCSILMVVSDIILNSDDAPVLLQKSPICQSTGVLPTTGPENRRGTYGISFYLPTMPIPIMLTSKLHAKTSHHAKTHTLQSYGMDRLCSIELFSLRVLTDYFE